MYGNVIYVPRSVYADRESLLARHASIVAGDDGSIMWLHDEVKVPLMHVENHSYHQREIKGNMSCSHHYKEGCRCKGGWRRRYCNIRNLGITVAAMKKLSRKHC